MVNEINENQAKKQPKKFGVVTYIRLNVRQRPSFDSDVITVIEENQKVQIISSKSNSDFYKVIVNGVEGYCAKDFVEVIDNG